VAIVATFESISEQMIDPLHLFTKKCLATLFLASAAFYSTHP